LKQIILLLKKSNRIKMRIGLYFGSFNPIHVGHLIIGNQLAESGYVDEVWFVVSPQNPDKSSNSLLNERHRLQMVRLALENSRKLKTSSVEFNLPKPSYTINTIAYLEEKYPDYKFSILLGSDGFQNIDHWKNAELLKEKLHFFVYKRPGFELIKRTDLSVTILETPLLDISSTYIRKRIKENKSIEFLVPDSVRTFIDGNLFYQR
jgi:nicotinate-nucleotide adenylyltransferase